MITQEKDINKANLSKELKNIAGEFNLKEIEDTLYFPKRLVIETIRICNARCPFCAIDIWDKSVPLISDKLFDKIVEEISDYSDWIQTINIQRAGEPTLDKKMGQRIKKLSDIGIKTITMSTNAERLFKEKSKEYLGAGLNDIMISIDSIKKDQYEKYRVGLHFERVMKNIKNLFQVRDEINPEAIIRIRGVSFHDFKIKEEREEYQEWEDYFKQFSKEHDQIYMKKPFNWANQKEWDDNLPEYDLVHHPCIILWSTMNILTSGEVAFCNEDFDGNVKIGNVNKDSIANIWRSGVLTKFRSLHESGNRNQISFCKGCRVFDKDMKLDNWRETEEMSA